MLASALPAHNPAAIDPAQHDVVGVAAGLLLDSVVLGVEPANGGGNNRVFRITTSFGPVALKFYPRQAADPRDRLGPEVNALRFLEQYGVSQVPQVLGECAEIGVAAFTWIDGERVTDPHETDIDAALRLMMELRALVDVLGVTRIGAASAATFSGDEVLLQVRSRLNRVRAVACEHAALASFLDAALAPAFGRIAAWSQDVYASAGLSFTAPIPPAERTLSPSDFGFHNALGAGGTITFIDFEYFGWDDPAKMVSDFLLHPGSTLTPALRRRLVLGARGIFGGASSPFAARLHALYPLYGLCWVLILLNEFLPERWARRSLGRDGLDQGEIQARQLGRARSLLERIEATYATGPDLG